MKSLPLFAPILSLALLACENGPDKPSTSSGDDSGGDSGAWAVGEAGLMLRVGADHKPSQYPLGLDVDLRAIACKGAEQAVVAGAGGLVLTTVDGGQEWTRLEVPGAPELRAVALSAGAVGFVAGDGVLLRSQDDARSWEALPVAAHDWTAVTTTATGATVLLANAAGELFRLQDDGLTRVYAGAGVPLRGVAITPDGSEAVAVGDAGLLLRSGDGGERWAPEALPTGRDLQAVRIAGDASLIVAVGAAGTIVRLGPDDVGVRELLDPALSLRALHLDQHGHGHVVGDHGVMFETHDAGLAWAPIEHEFTSTLLGLDDLHGEPHL